MAIHTSVSDAENVAIGSPDVTPVQSSPPSTDPTRNSSWLFMAFVVLAVLVATWAVVKHRAANLPDNVHAPRIVPGIVPPQDAP